MAILGLRRRVATASISSALTRNIDLKESAPAFSIFIAKNMRICQTDSSRKLNERRRRNLTSQASALVGSRDGKEPPAKF
eukprot:scaffold205073_cov38-Prasinocladus_malaysianus.AAC.2